MSLGTPFAHGHGNHILAEIMTGLWIGQVLIQQPVKVRGVEDVDAHAGQRQCVIAGHRRRISGLFDEFDYSALRIDGHHAKRRGIGSRNLNATHCAVGATVHMVLEHQGIVHLVDVVASQHHDVFGFA